MSTARMLAPIAAMGATWAARRGMAAIYTARTGHAPPSADDREVSLVSVVAWAVTTAMVSATINVVFTYVAAGITSDDDHDAAALPQSSS